MANAVKLFLLFIAATILHWGLMTVLGGAGVNLNMMLVFACAVCACLGPQYGYPTAFICGLFLDFFGIKLFGNHAFVFTLCACMMYGLDKRLDFDAPVPQMASILVLSLFSALFNAVLLHVFAGFSSWAGIGSWLGGAVCNALTAPFVFWTVRRTFKRER